MDPQPPTTPRWLWPGFLIVALLLGALVRCPAVTAGYPYLEYVDEGHVLGPVQRTLATGRWDPADNLYPEFPILAIAAACRLVSPLAQRWPVFPSLGGILPQTDFYDQIEPPQLILVGRSLVLLLSLGTIVLVGRLAQRLAGEAAGGVAALAAALLPALVFRGAIVTVDGFATFFVLAALVLLAGVVASKQFGRWAAVGACCGLAAVSKYPAGLVFLVVVVVALEREGWAWRDRLRAIALAAAGAAGAAAAVMPSCWEDPSAVWQRILTQRSIYSSMTIGSYWKQAFERVEWDLPSLPYPELGVVLSALALVGLAWLMRRRPSRGLAIGLAVFSTALIALYSQYGFQAFRNLLPVAALACVAAGAAVAAASRPLGGSRLAALLGAGLLVALLGPSARDYAVDRFTLEDSRSDALDWLAHAAPPGASVLVMAEGAFAHSEVARLPQQVEIAPWDHARLTLRKQPPRFLIVANIQDGGELLVPRQDRAWILARYRLRATFGDAGALADPWFWRGSDLRVWILEWTGRPEPLRG